MWCARLPLPRPGDTVVVCAGRNWAALWVAFFLSAFLTQPGLEHPGLAEKYRLRCISHQAY